MNRRRPALLDREVEHSGVLLIARALREQINWEQLAERTGKSPFARAFFLLADGLGVADSGSSAILPRADDRDHDGSPASRPA